MDQLKTELITDVAQAADLLCDGHLVAFATETVYGLGADATNGTAVAQIYAAKGRPQFNPLIMHVPSLEAARSLATFSPLAEKLAAAFWPGPLTLVLPRSTNCPVSTLACAGLDTIALRCPAHPQARQLLTKANRPIAAPSANPSGAISPTSAAHVLDGLSGKIAAVLEGGPCEVGLESTILSVTDTATLLRPGGLTSESIEALLGHPLKTPQTAEITAPGQLASHYAPNTKLTLNATKPIPGNLWLGFGSMPNTATGLNLSQTSNLTEAAANLFDHLRRLDAIASKNGHSQINAAPVPNTGLGLAINDRLKRAAAPKP